MALAYSYGEWPTVGPIYGFDLDGTLVESKQLMPGRVEVIQKIVREGGRIAIFSNQSRLKPATIEARFRILDGLGVPWKGWAATDKDKYRKPGVGMLELLGEKLHIFVGDSAGRKGDYSANDIDFAKACGCSFQVPEAFFTVEYKQPEIDYKQLVEYDNIVIVGAPASGKSMVARELEKLGYTVVSNDLGVTAGGAATKVVIDNTNATKALRAPHIKPGKTLCLHMNIPPHVCQARNDARVAGKVPTMVYKVYYKKFEAPTMAEGFAKVLLV